MERSIFVIEAKSGRAIHFNETGGKANGRTATGVKSNKVKSMITTNVIGMVCAPRKMQPCVKCLKNGYGKRSNLDQYRIT